MKSAVLERCGFKQDWQDKHVYHSRHRRVELSLGMDWPRFSLAVFDSEYFTLCLGLLLGTFYIKIKPWKSIGYLNVFELAYGFYFSDDALVLEWGKARKFFHYPWSLNFHKRWEQVLMGYGLKKEKYWIAIQSGMPYDELGTQHQADYTYTRKDGEIQNRKATFSVSRSEWRRRICPWTSWFNKVRVSIWVKFDEEIGEQTGSWKGGVTGCGYDMLPGEEAVDTLRRMERERIFK